jgi:hypothetical protein
MVLKPKLLIGLFCCLFIVGVLLTINAIYKKSHKGSEQSQPTSVIPINTESSKPVRKYSGDYSILMNQPWVSTDIPVKAGQTLVITASGKGIWKNISADSPDAKSNPFEECGPDGTPPTNKQEYYSNIRNYQCSTAYKGALIGRIGENGIPFAVGSNFKEIVNQSGLLYLGINDQRPDLGDNWSDNSGGFPVMVNVERKEVIKEINVLGTMAWMDTGIEVEAGDSVTISASGAVRWEPIKAYVGPDGLESAYAFNLPNQFPLPSAKAGSLVMKIGSDLYAVGAETSIQTSGGGNIQFMVNDRFQGLGDNEGSFSVTIKVK